MADKGQNEISKILFEQGKITFKKLQEILKEAERINLSPDELLQKQNIVSEKDIIEAKSIFFKIPIAELSGSIIDKTVLNILPQDLAESYKMLVFAQDKEKIKVMLVNPGDFKAQEVMNFIAKEKKMKVEYYVVSLSSWRRGFLQYSGLSEKIEESIKLSPKDFLPSGLEMREEKVWLGAKTPTIIQEAPITKLVDGILTDAVESNASDIHIELVDNSTVIRYRIDGVLHSKAVLPSYLHSTIISRIKVMANLKLDETRIPQDGRIRTNLLGRFVDIRISTLPLLNNEKIVLRILDPAKDIFNLKALGFWGKGLEIIENSIKKSYGMFLATGPTGCGKTTTLYSLLQILNRPEVNIVTLEDPVEYILSGINQSQIRPAVGYTFAAGLRAIVRQDPNIVMVGEIRDDETAELAVHAALTGHIVLSTLHTNNAFGAIPRLIDMKVEPFLITSSLNVIIAQRLVRKICSFCKTKVKIFSSLEKEVLDQISLLSSLPEVKEILKNKISFYKSKGCPRCKGEGFEGRLAIFEILGMTEGMREIVLRGCHLEEVKAEFVKQEMLSMYQDGLIKVLQGFTTLEEVLRVSKE